MSETAEPSLCPVDPTPPGRTTRVRPPPMRRLGLRVLHHLLTPGWFRHTPAARLRGWERLLDWKEGSFRARLKILKRTVFTPLRAWRDAGVEVARVGARIQAVSGTRPLTQRWHMFVMIARYGMEPTQYAGYAFYEPSRRSRVAAFVQSWEYFRVVRWYNEQLADNDAPLLTDKVRYTSWCRGNGIPTVESILEVQDGRIVGRDQMDAVRMLPARDLFSKPTEGTGGYAAERWQFDRTSPHPSWIGSDGRRRSADELLEELCRESTTLPGKYGRSAHRILLQPCVQNHRALRPITTATLCTARIVVCRMPGGKAHAVAAAFRMATGNATADNFSTGGIAAAVDLRTGTLGNAVRLVNGLLESVTHHPDTGTLLRGFQLPLWDEAVAIAERGLDVAKRLPSIGWDVALTDDGPLMIEANPASHPGIAQRASGVPLSATPLPDSIDAHMRELLFS